MNIKKNIIRVIVSVLIFTTILPGCSSHYELEVPAEPLEAEVVPELLLAMEVEDNINEPSSEPNDFVDEVEPPAEEKMETEPEEIFLDFESGTFQQSYICSSGNEIKYAVKIPENMTANMPLLVWLHGQGDGKIQRLTNGWGAIKAANAISENRIVIIQPCGAYGWHVDEQQEMVMELIDFIVKEYSIDENRIILSGHSLGAFGAWIYAEEMPEKWAAVVPVSNKSPITLDTFLTSDVPVWAFWSNWDVNSNIYGMRRDVETLRTANPDREVLSTEIQNVSHTDMSDAPYTKEFFDWAILQVRPHD